MADFATIIQFLRACYEADNRQSSVGNLFHKSIRHLQFIEGEDRLMCGFLPRVPLPAEAARAALADAQLYRREKALLYCALPIIGSVPARGLRPASSLCAPLLLYPARLSEGETCIQLEIDLAQQQVNLPLLAELVPESQSAGVGLDEFAATFPQAPFEADDIPGLIALLQDFIPHLDALALTTFPTLQNEAEVRRKLREVDKAEERLFCVPACALALAPNSPNARGVLFELEELAKTAALSKPLRHVLGERAATRTRKLRPVTRVPAILSQSQQRVLASAATAPLTLVVGPPGTGKSYTIAAMAVDHVGRDESVLIACRKHQAVDVVAQMLGKMLGPNECVIRGGQSQHVRELKKFLEGILQGIRRQLRTSKRGGPASGGNPDRELVELDRRISRMESQITSHLRDEMKWGEIGTTEPSNFFHRLLRQWQVHALTRRLARQPELWHRLQQYDRTLEESNDQTRELLKRRIDQRIERTLQDHRRDLTRFLDSLRTRSSTRQEKLFAEVDPRLLFRTFPVWLTTVADIAELVPLAAEPFDVVIFDEATQCDMASCLPILQRAKRAVVVGDPNQLRHISFLSTDRMTHFAEQHALDTDQRQQFHYRDKSFLDLVNENIDSQEHVHFLNEHFRSLPGIIRFSNEQFYHEALSVMRLRPKTARTRCVVSRFVPDGKKEGGANSIEGRALVDEVARLIEAQRSLPPDACQSIGILSPFREQVDLLAKKLEGRLSLDAFTRHDLRVGTAHAFQGDERDIMFLSLVVDKDAHHSSLRFLDQPNLFNVTITRARHQQYVFHSVSADQLAIDSLLRTYLESIKSQVSGARADQHVADEFLKEVRDAVSREGFHVGSEYELAGVMIDLIAERDGATVGIDLVGYPGDFGAALDLERYRILRRAGFPLFPLPYRRWREDAAACLQAISACFRAAAEG